MRIALLLLVLSVGVSGATHLTAPNPFNYTPINGTQANMSNLSWDIGENLFRGHSVIGGVPDDSSQTTLQYIVTGLFILVFLAALLLRYGQGIDLMLALMIPLAFVLGAYGLLPTYIAVLAGGFAFVIFIWGLMNAWTR